MFRKLIAYTIYFFALIYFAASFFIKPHLAPFYGPKVGGEFSKYPSCERNIEALVIASGAMSHLYEGADFGLGEAAHSLRRVECDWRTAKFFTNDYINSIEHWSENNAQELIPSKPSILFYRKAYEYRPVSDPKLDGYNPDWPLGDIWLLIKNYPDLNSGNGIKHYLRCDYSLNLEPYHSFILSDLHRGGYINEATIERINECGLHDMFRKEIDEILTASSLLPPIFRDRSSSMDQ